MGFKVIKDLDLIEAKRVHRNYTQRLERLRIKASGGDKNASHKIIQVMTEHCKALKQLGFRITDDGKIEPVTQKWIDESRAKMTEIDLLMEKGRMGDPAAINQAILLMAEKD